MSFRGRLRVFFTIIVIVPMIALAVVLLRLAAQSETGKADAGIATGVRTALAVYEDAERDARAALQRVGQDPVVQAAVTTDDRERVATRVGTLLRQNAELASIALADRGGNEIVTVGKGVAPASLRLTRPGRRVGGSPLCVGHDSRGIRPRGPPPDRPRRCGAPGRRAHRRHRHGPRRGAAPGLGGVRVRWDRLPGPPPGDPTACGPAHRARGARRVVGPRPSRSRTAAC